jgi:signal transduction histidine kinase
VTPSPRTSLRRRLATGLVCLACLGVAVQFAIFGRIAAGMRQDVAERDLELAKALAGEVANALAQPEHALGVLAGMLDRGLSGAELSAALEHLRLFTKVMDAVQVLDLSGRVTAVSPASPGQIGLDFSNQPFFREARARAGPVFTDSFLSSQTSRAAASISMGFSGGVAAMQLRVEEISRLTMVLPPPNGGFIAILDSRGVVIGHTDPGKARARESLLGLESVKRGLAGQTSSLVESLGGVEGVASVSPAGSSGWLVVVFEPSSHAYAAVRDLYQHTLAGVGVVAVFSVLALLIFRQQVLKPIGELAGRTKAVSGGDYDGAVDPIFKEFEELAGGFTSMAQAIKTREEALRGGRRRLLALVDAMPSFLASTGPDGLIDLWNAEAEKLTRVKAGTARGQHFEDAVPQLTPVLPALHQAQVMGIAVKWEQLRAGFGEDERILDVLVYPLGDGGVVVRIDDVTDRCRMEEVMVHSEKMMTVGGLAAGMAHEINNPLGGIVMSAQNLERRLSPAVPGNQKAAAEAGVDLAAVHAYLQKRGVLEQVANIRELGSRAAKIISHMLGFARRSHSGFLPVAIEEVIERALELTANDYELKKALDFRKVAVHRDLDPELPTIPANRNQIEQVLLNLFKNAGQAMAETAAKRAPELWIRAWRAPDELVVEVRDNGPGMEDKVRERIFEPFFTTKEVGQGTGLGLSVSYYIVTTMHKGSIVARSAPGQGTAFIVSLPLKREDIVCQDEEGKGLVCRDTEPEDA